MTSLQWVQTVLSLVFQSTLVIAVTCILDKTFHSSETRVRIWTSLYLSIIGLVAAGLLLPRLQLFNPWANIELIVLVDVARAQHVIGLTLLVIWAAGTLVILSKWLISHLAFQRIVKRCPSATAEQQLMVLRLVDESLLTVNGRSVSVYVGPEELGPFCYQLHRPIVVIPASLFDGDRDDLRNVLIHELTHLKSQHAMQLFLEKVAQAVLWFQPLVWLSSRQASLVREFECDDASSGNREATIGYLKTLIKIVECRKPLHSGSLQIGRTMSQLRTRAKRLATRGEVRNSQRSGFFIAIPILVATLVSQCWLPTNPLAATNSRWTAWPTWSAVVLHELNIPARDFERFDGRREMYELMLSDKSLAQN